MCFSISVHFLFRMEGSTNMTNTTQKYPGITSPISLVGPKQQDIDLTTKLEETMKPFGVFESEDELAKRLI